MFLSAIGSLITGYMLYWSLLIQLINALRTKNITITIPEGTANHGDPHLLCMPTKWYEIVIFYLGNYIAQSATIKFSPGEPIIIKVRFIIYGLLYPTTGIQKGLNAIARSAKFAKNDLQMAARAGALCMVIRSESWIPMAGQQPVHDIKLNKRSVSLPCQ